MWHMMRRVCQVLATAMVGGCSSAPASLQPIAQFQADRYVGTWYEIARLDHSLPPKRALSSP